MSNSIPVLSMARGAMVALGLLGAAMTLTPAAVGAEPMATVHPPVCWTDFDAADPGTGRVRFPAPRPLPDGDRISVRRTYTAAPGMVTFTFTTGLAVDWWKELKVESVDRSGRLTTQRLALENGQFVDPDLRGRGVAVSGSALQPSITVPANEVRRVVFSKAKFLGIHTEMYELASYNLPGRGACNLGSLAGQAIQFSWNADW